MEEKTPPLFKVRGVQVIAVHLTSAVCGHSPCLIFQVKSFNILYARIPYTEGALGSLINSSPVRSLD
jgi:hypothetical protein